MDVDVDEHVLIISVSRDQKRNENSEIRAAAHLKKYAILHKKSEEKGV